MKKINYKKQRGVTIIALTVTIIVLLILAGISISILTGDNKLIGKSQQSKRETEIMQYQEKLEILKQLEYTNNYTTDIAQFLDNYVDVVEQDEMFKENKGIASDVENNLVTVITKEGYKFEVTIDDVIYVGDENDNNIDINNVKITIVANPTDWTKNSVRVKILANTTNVIKQYSLDGGNNWNRYENEIEIQDNETEVQARVVNDNNEVSNIVTKRIENIDRLEPNNFTPRISKTTNTITVEATTTDKEATTKDGKSGIRGYKFSKDNGSNWTDIKAEGRYVFENLKEGSTYPIKVKAIDNAGNEISTNTINTTIEEEIIVPDGEGRISFAKEPNGWTKGPVRVEISTREQGYGIEYSLDGSKYTSYSGPIEVSENKTIYARLTKGGKVGKNTTYAVDNIDRLQPKEFAVNIQGKTTNSIVVEGNTTDAESTSTDGSSGIRGYRFSKDNGASWTEEQTSGRYVFTGLNAGTSYPIKVKAIDNAGNERETITITEGTTQIPSGEGNIIINATPNNWTNGTVRVEIQSKVEGYRLQYSINGVNWSDYNGEIQISDNRTTIYARLYDGTSAGDVTSKTISNIDRLSPNTFTPAVQVTTNSITIEANTTDRQATSTDGSSGIKGYRFSKDNGYSWTGEQVGGTYTFSGLTSGTSYQVKVKAIDNAGNEYETTEKNVQTNQLPNPEEQIQITKTPSNWTNGTVTVRMTNMAQEYILQYSKDNRSWQTYLSPITVVNNNETIYARLYEPNSQEVTRSISTQITNIDRLSPTIFTPTVNARIDTITVTANTADREATAIDGKSGIRGYKFSKDGGYSWTDEQVSETYTFGRLTPGTSYQIRVKAVDNAGNEMESYEVTGTTIEIPGGNSNIYFSYSPSEWTNGNVTVTITATTSNYRLQYSKDGYTWYNYDSYQKVTMTENGPVYARLTDGVNYGTIATGNVSNIDKIAPNVSYSTNPSAGVASEVTIYINATDSLSGISSITNTTYDNIRKIDDTTYIVTANGTYYFTVTDQAGNNAFESVTINNIQQKEAKVGDYVKYTPSNQYSYSLTSEYTGYYTNQTIQQESDFNWKIYSMDNNKITLISDRPTRTNIFLSGANGYNNAVQALNDVCRNLYSNYTYGTARSIKIEDIEKYSKYDKNAYVSEGGINYGGTKTYTGYDLNYPNKYPLEKGSGVNSYSVNQNGLSGSDEGSFVTGSSAPNYVMTMTQNYYYMNNYSAKQSFEEIPYKLIINDNGTNFNYWVATRTNLCYTQYGDFGIRDIYNGGMGGGGLLLSNNTNNDIVSTLSRPIRPIVELNSNISIDVNNAYNDGKTPQTGWELK